MKEIPLTRGKVALVDEADYKWLSKHKWCFCPNRRGYAIRRAPKGSPTTTIAMARAIMQPPPGMWVDHINGDTLDNRRANLRLCTHQQNQMNVKMNVRNTSGFRGIRQHRRNRWVAMISVAGRPRYIGIFPTPEAAARAFDREAVKLRGEFARLNFPEEHARAA